MRYDSIMGFLRYSKKPYDNVPQYLMRRRMKHFIDLYYNI